MNEKSHFFTGVGNPIGLQWTANDSLGNDTLCPDYQLHTAGAHCGHARKGAMPNQFSHSGELDHCITGMAATLKGWLSRTVEWASQCMHTYTCTNGILFSGVAETAVWVLHVLEAK